MAQNNQIQRLSNSDLAEGTTFNPRQVQLVKTQIMPGANDDDLMLFLQVSSRRGLDPFMKHVYAVQYSGKWSYQVSIDGLRLIAQRSGRYRGQTEPQWCGVDGQWVDVWLKEEPPAAARVGVWIEGNPQPLMAITRYEAFVAPSPAKPNSFWTKMPDHMLAKCAEAQALRKAFPEEAGGLYTSDEMQQAKSDRPVVDADGVIEGSARVVNEQRRAPSSPLEAAKLELWTLAKGMNLTKDQLNIVGEKLTGEPLTKADEERLTYIHDELLKMETPEVMALIESAEKVA